MPCPTAAQEDIANLVVEIKRLRARVNGLLEANNREVERRRAAERDAWHYAGRAIRAEALVHEIIAKEQPAPDPACEFALHICNGAPVRTTG